MGARKIETGDTVRRVGKWLVLKRPDDVVIAKTKGWELVEVQGWERDGWINLKLFRMAIAKKNVYYIGINCESFEFGRNKDQVVLINQHPEIIPWIINSVKNKYGG